MGTATQTMAELTPENTDEVEHKESLEVIHLYFLLVKYDPALAHLVESAVETDGDIHHQHEQKQQVEHYSVGVGELAQPKAGAEADDEAYLYQEYVNCQDYEQLLEEANGRGWRYVPPEVMLREEVVGLFFLLFWDYRAQPLLNGSSRGVVANGEVILLDKL